MRESPAGRFIFDALKDGQPHLMLLAIQFRKDAPNILGDPERCVWITNVISDKPYVYDESMASRFTSPIVLPRSQPDATETPFIVSDVQGRWIVNENVLGGKRIVVPEVRFRVTAKTAPVTKLRVKIVYLERRRESTEILDETVEDVIGDTALQPGYSKFVISHSGAGYGDLWAPGQTIDKDVSVDLSYDVGDGYAKLGTVPVNKSSPFR